MEHATLSSATHDSALAPLPVRTLMLAAFQAPAWVVAAPTLARLAGGAEATSATVFGVVLALGWLALFLRSTWRDTFARVGDLLGRRAGLVPLLTLTAMALVFASAVQSVFWSSAAGVLGFLCLAEAARSYLANRKHFLFGSILLGLFVLLLFAADLLIRWTVLPDHSHNTLFVEHDPVLGWKLIPGMKAERSNPKYTAFESINSLGFRTSDVPFEKPAGTKRIVILGDSQTEGYTVNDEETYARTLERELSGDAPVEVVSLGVGGFSTDQELLTYLHFGRRFEPDLVLLQFTGNDIAFNALDHYWRGRKPLFKRYGETLVLTGVPVPKVRDTGLIPRELLKFSAIAVLVERRLRRLAVTHDVEKNVDMEEAWRVTELLFRDLKAVVRSDGAELLVFHEAGTHDRLEEVLARHAIPFIQIEPAYEGDPPSMRIKDDGHWNQKGHAAIGRFLAEALRPRLFPTPIR